MTAQATPPTPGEHFDVLIVGAGLSGIGAACHLQTRCPDKSYAILEARAASGGTWDLFRYPGMRSDSDMYTLGYRFAPWRSAAAIADGASILDYVRGVARAHGVDKKIRYRHRATDLSWDSSSARWTVTAEKDGAPVRLTCNFLWMCSGYYKYAEGYAPELEGAARFRGDIVHPQSWPQDLDYTAKRDVVIGSGATAVTLIPAMAGKAAHITMLQRSPSYVFSMPSQSPLAKALVRVLPAAAAYRAVRWRSILYQQLMYALARARPQQTADSLLALTRAKLPPGYDVETHFTPRYKPWDQRLCITPDDALFAALAAGKASVETGVVERFTETGVQLTSGKQLAADIVVTATGLALEALGGARIAVDGRAVDLGKTFTYRGLGFSGVPNLAAVFGYANASWTLRADLVGDYVCRLIKYMDRNGHAVATPVNDDPLMPAEPFLDFSSGYVTRALHRLPKQGRAPWRRPQNYFADVISLRFGRLDDGVMKFQRRAAPKPVRRAAEAMAAAE